MGINIIINSKSKFIYTLLLNMIHTIWVPITKGTYFNSYYGFYSLRLLIIILMK